MAVFHWMGRSDKEKKLLNRNNTEPYFWRPFADVSVVGVSSYSDFQCILLDALGCRGIKPPPFRVHLREPLQRIRSFITGVKHQTNTIAECRALDSVTSVNSEF